MGCHPSHWRTHIFQDGYCTTNQLLFEDTLILVEIVSPWMIQNLDLNQQLFSSIGRLHSCSHDILKNVSYTSFPSCAFLIGFGWILAMIHPPPPSTDLGFCQVEFQWSSLWLSQQRTLQPLKQKTAFCAKLAAVIWSQSGENAPSKKGRSPKCDVLSLCLEWLLGSSWLTTGPQIWWNCAIKHGLRFNLGLSVVKTTHGISGGVLNFGLIER